MKSRLPIDDDNNDESYDSKAMPVGLAKNPSGINFECGTCEWFDKGYCWNKNKAIHGKKVNASWCCNLYDNDKMKVIVK